MEDFDRIILKDVVIEIVNLTRATCKEALDFKDVLSSDMDRNFKKIVIDIRQCEFIDSTFLGAMVFIKKRLFEVGGDVRIVKSHSNIRTIMEKVGTNKFFSIYDSIESAVRSYDTDEVLKNSQPGKQVHTPRKKTFIQKLLSS
ncbi:MAG: STAS domain-containing protein [Ignavibacteriaceae bacterium]